MDAIANGEELRVCHRIDCPDGAMAADFGSEQPEVRAESFRAGQEMRESEVTRGYDTPAERWVVG